MQGDVGLAMTGDRSPKLGAIGECANMATGDWMANGEKGAESGREKHCRCGVDDMGAGSGGVPGA